MIFGIGTDLVDIERIKAMKSKAAFAKKNTWSSRIAAI